MRDVFIRICADTVLCFSNEVFALAELRCTCRTRFGTSCLLTGLEPIRTHDAFANLRIQCSPLVLGNRERAGSHAISAADALVGVIDNRASSRLVKRAHRTRRSARGLFAMLAKATHVLLVMVEDDGELMFRLNGFSRHLVVVGQVVVRRTGGFALCAVDAESWVIQNGLTHTPSTHTWTSAVFRRGTALPTT